jgi:hypothetical protein
MRAGSSCESFKDCVSSVESVYAECDCSYSRTNKICSILGGNEEYKEYVSAVKEFVQASKHCHNARSVGDGQCD